MKPALLIGVLFALAAGCAPRPAPTPRAVEPQYPGRIGLMSDTFIARGAIPQRFARDGENLSPPLVWTNLPMQTEELAIIMTNLDAPRGQAVYWVAYGIPATHRFLQGGLPRQELPMGIRQGRNDFGRLGYDGPAPPPGAQPQRYAFRLYALNRRLDLRPGVNAETLLRAMQGHVVDVGELVGTYQR